VIRKETLWQCIAVLLITVTDHRVQPFHLTLRRDDRSYDLMALFKYAYYNIIIIVTRGGHVPALLQKVEHGGHRE